MDNTNKNILTEATTDDGSVGTPAGSIDYSNSKILIENTSTFGYRLYLEYAKEVLQMNNGWGSKVVQCLGGVWFMLISAAITAYLLSVGGIPAMQKEFGFLDTVIFVIGMPFVFLFGLICFLFPFFPHVMLASRIRTKHSKKFFTDAKGIRHKKVTVKATFYEQGITMERAGVVEEYLWSDIEYLAKSKNFYFLVLVGEIADPWPYWRAYIKTGIILKKDGFTKGSWEELQGYLAQYCSEGLCKQ